MPSTSISNEVTAKYDALTASNFPGGARPPIYFGAAPQVTSGLQLRPPYTVFSEGARRVQPLDFERNSLVTVQLFLDVYANSLAEVDTIVNCIRFNSATPVVGTGSGFDYGTVSGLSSPRSTHQLVPVGEPRRLE